MREPWTYPYTASEMRMMLKALTNQDLVTTSFVIMLRPCNGDWINPYRRPHHPTAWPLPIYRNDNVL